KVLQEPYRSVEPDLIGETGLIGFRCDDGFGELGAEQRPRTAAQIRPASSRVRRDGHDGCGRVVRAPGNYRHVRPGHGPYGRTGVNDLGPRFGCDSETLHEVHGPGTPVRVEQLRGARERYFGYRPAAKPVIEPVRNHEAAGRTPEDVRVLVTV